MILSWILLPSGRGTFPGESIAKGSYFVEQFLRLKDLFLGTLDLKPDLDTSNNPVIRLSP